MKTFYNILIVIFLCFVCYAAGWYSRKPEQVVKTVEVIKNVDHIVYRDYSKADCCYVAKNYDSTPFNLNYEVKELNPQYTDVSLRWDLYERNGEQEIKVPVYQAGNWRYYVIGGSAVIIGGYGGYKLYKFLH